MNLLHTAYKLAGHACAALVLPPLGIHRALRGDDLTRFNARLGVHPRSLQNAFQGTPRIWLHAVSVGEVSVALAIVQAIKIWLPQCCLAVSVATEQGMERAKTLLSGSAVCFYAPLDLTSATRRTMKMVRPQVLAMLETEIWPNLIVTAHQMGVRTAILNGRISVRAIKKYRKVRPLMRHILSHVDAFSMISDQDAMRIRSIGAVPDRLVVNGNAKFDGPDPYPDAVAERRIKDLFNLTGDSRVFVAGSTRHGEEPQLLEAFMVIRRVFPDCVLILAPRHIHRTEQIEYWIRETGLVSQRRTLLDQETRPRTAPVIILDTIGELSAIYSCADFVFCGGSLVGKGGQNILEPALWAKPIMYGPSMEDFSDAKLLLENNGAGFIVHDAAELASLAITWLRQPDQARSIGRRARQAILSHRGAAAKHAGVVMRLLGAGSRD